MSKPVDDNKLMESYRWLLRCGNNYAEAARESGIPRSTIQNHVRQAEARGLTGKTFKVEDLPKENLSPEELIARNLEIYRRKRKAKQARKLIDVAVNVKGPFALAFMGDPHVDDDGCNWEKLNRDVDILSSDKRFLAINVGDLQNNWIGRLASKYGDQTTTAKEAWVLTEWLVNAVPWLAIVGGNHDAWTGKGDPLDWICTHADILMEYDQVRLNLCLPGGRRLRVNTRHDWPGVSQWNKAHGASKAVQMGWKDHIVACGHRHASGHNYLKCPATGLISHAFMVSAYKEFDPYASQKGFADANIFNCPAIVVDPRYDEDDSRFLKFFPDLEDAQIHLDGLTLQKNISPKP